MRSFDIFRIEVSVGFQLSEDYFQQNIQCATENTFYLDAAYDVDMTEI